MSQKENAGKESSVSFFCDCLSISRQGYYKSSYKESEVDILKDSIIEYCYYIRKELMPKSGMRELYSICCRYFKEKMIIGRDQFYMMRNNGFTLRKRRRPRTTNSNHNFYIYPDLLNTYPKLIATNCCQLVVADIIYVATSAGWAYLSLLTDAATRVVVGYCLNQTLETEGRLEALRMALKFYLSRNVCIKGLIHHSDRGIQYCSNLYISELKKSECKISMTQTGDPLHNAMAERVNNTIKNGWLFDCEDKTFNDVKILVDKAICIYNNQRPHQALQMKTPIQAMEELVNIAS